MQPGQQPEQINRKGADYVTLARPGSLGDAESDSFSFSCAKGDPRTVLDAVMRLALTGVKGTPGGQDNAALIVTRV